MKTVIEAVKENIVKVSNVDAIVCAARSSLKVGNGVDRIIHEAAGPGLLDECKLAGGCNTGDAIITGAYNLPYKAIIHTVGPRWKNGSSGETILLQSCYLNALKLAEENGQTFGE